MVGDHFADDHQLIRPPHSALFRFGEVMHHFHAFRRIRLGATTMAGGPSFGPTRRRVSRGRFIGRRRRRWWRRFVHGGRSVEQRRLTWIELLARTAIDSAEQQVQAWLDLHISLTLLAELIE